VTFTPKKEGDYAEETSTALYHVHRPAVCLFAAIADCLSGYRRDRRD
jgi:hypothetical protein